MILSRMSRKSPSTMSCTSSSRSRSSIIKSDSIDGGGANDDDTGAGLDEYMGG